MSLLFLSTKDFAGPSHSLETGWTRRPAAPAASDGVAHSGDTQHRPQPLPSGAVSGCLTPLSEQNPVWGGPWHQLPLRGACPGRSNPLAAEACLPLSHAINCPMLLDGAIVLLTRCQSSAWVPRKPIDTTALASSAHNASCKTVYITRKSCRAACTGDEPVEPAPDEVRSPFRSAIPTQATAVLSPPTVERPLPGQRCTEQATLLPSVPAEPTLPKEPMPSEVIHPAATANEQSAFEVQHGAPAALTRPTPKLPSPGPGERAPPLGLEREPSERTRTLQDVMAIAAAAPRGAPTRAKKPRERSKERRRPAPGSIETQAIPASDAGLDSTRSGVVGRCGSHCCSWCEQSNCARRGQATRTRRFAA